MPSCSSRRLAPGQWGGGSEAGVAPPSGNPSCPMGVVLTGVRMESFIKESISVQCFQTSCLITEVRSLDSGASCLGSDPTSATHRLGNVNQVLETSVPQFPSL